MKLDMWNKSETKAGKCPDPFADKVKCDECACWIDKRDAKTVEVFSDAWPGGSVYTNSYCRAHKKPYSEVHGFPRSDTPTRYVGMVDMTEDGVPVMKNEKNRPTK